MQVNVHRLLIGVVGPRPKFQRAWSLFNVWNGQTTSVNTRHNSSAVGSGSRSGALEKERSKVKDAGSVRQLSALQTSKQPIGTKSSSDSEWLMSHFPEVLKETTEHVLRYSNVETANHFSNALQYTMKGGKNIRGLTASKTYEAFVHPDKLTPENVKLAGLLGITMEMSQAWILALDDIVDDSKLRRGQPCYYLTPGVGMTAINDGVLISKAQHYILKKYFRHLKCYPKLMERFNDGEFITMCGQTTDFLSSKKSVEQFSLDLYKSIAVTKTSYYTFNLPVSLGMCLANFDEPAIEEEIHAILAEIGCYFQIQDDYLDCFGSEAVIGKVGNDILEGKCTWLAAKFMEIASEEQKKVFKEVYGTKDQQIVKQLYNDVGMQVAYKALEDDMYHMIKESINMLPREVPRTLFHGFVDGIYARTG